MRTARFPLLAIRESSLDQLVFDALAAPAGGEFCRLGKLHAVLRVKRAAALSSLCGASRRGNGSGIRGDPPAVIPIGPVCANDQARTHSQWGRGQLQPLRFRPKFQRETGSRAGEAQIAGDIILPNSIIEAVVVAFIVTSGEKRTSALTGEIDARPRVERAV